MAIDAAGGIGHFSGFYAYAFGRWKRESCQELHRCGTGQAYLNLLPLNTESFYASYTVYVAALLPKLTQSRTMTFSKGLLTLGVSIVSAIVYFLRVAYSNRARIDELRKQGVVSFLLARESEVLY